MTHCLRTAGCPFAERKVLTEPTGGASPAFAPVGVETLLAQPRHPGRAVVLIRRRKVRDDFLGREGNPSQSPSRKGRRQTLNSCLVQPVSVDASLLNESLAPVSRASSATSFEKKLDHSVPSGVRPLDFRDHIAVRRRLRPPSQHHGSFSNKAKLERFIDLQIEFTVLQPDAHRLTFVEGGRYELMPIHLVCATSLEQLPTCGVYWRARHLYRSVVSKTKVECHGPVFSFPHFTRPVPKDFHGQVRAGGPAGGFRLGVRLRCPTRNCGRDRQLLQSARRLGTGLGVAPLRHRTDAQGNAQRADGEKQNPDNDWPATE